jgi:transaldolase
LERALPLLHRMTVETPTELWNDSCEIRSLARAIASGATGATSNPVIVMSAIEADRARWDDLTRAMLRDRPTASEGDIAWELAIRAAQEGAALLMPTFERSGGSRGRMSIQTDPALFRSAPELVAQGERFAAIAPNVAIKVPATAAGIVAIEELTARGIVTNTTVSFSVAQAVAAAEAVERGLSRIDRGIDRARVTPWVTIMVGRIDDHLRDVAAVEHIDIDVERIRHASLAIFRRAYRIFRERGYRARLLAAAMRSHHHWSEFVGGEVVVTIPPEWQDRFEASGVELRSRIDDEVDPAIIGELSRKLPDFRRAYEENGLSITELDSFGATIKTLRQFLGAVDRLKGYVRDVMLPPPAMPAAPASKRTP